MTVLTEPCSWPVLYPGCSADADPEDLPAPLDGMDDDQRALYELMATTHLWRWTGRRYGLCDVTVRPCRTDCFEGRSTYTGGGRSQALSSGSGYSAPFTPVLVGGSWFNIACGSCGDDCSCGYTPTLILPGPVESITQVRIDGATLDPVSYRVDNRKRLIRVDGGDWPTCQDMAADPSDQYASTFEISYTRGIEVPVGGQIAAGLLAVEFAKAVCKDPSCALPKRVQSISRQGVTVAAVLDSFDDIDTGHTGIWLVDSWVASVMKSPRTSRVLSPDLPRSDPRRTTWTAS